MEITKNLAGEKFLYENSVNKGRRNKYQRNYGDCSTIDLLKIIVAKNTEVDHMQYIIHQFWHENEVLRWKVKAY